MCERELGHPRRLAGQRVDDGLDVTCSHLIERESVERPQVPARAGCDVVGALTHTELVALEVVVSELLERRWSLVDVGDA